MLVTTRGLVLADGERGPFHLACAAALSIGIGMALSARLDKSDARTYVVLGDGEIQEGQIWEAAMFAGYHKVDNFLTIPTDCPQRNERCGYTGDAQFFMRAAVYNMDVAAFFSRATK